MARAVCGALAFAALAGCTNESAPEPAAAKGEAMVAAADPLAVEAGLEILRAGGSAVDAAIAVEMVLGLVEPESSGVGGGGFLVHYRASDEAIDAYDGREWAPAGATPDMFMVDGKPMSFELAQARKHFDSSRVRGGKTDFGITEAEQTKRGERTWPRINSNARNRTSTWAPLATSTTARPPWLRP